MGGGGGDLMIRTAVINSFFQAFSAIPRSLLEIPLNPFALEKRDDSM